MYNYVYLSYQPFLPYFVMLNYKVKICRFLIVALFCIFTNVKLKALAYLNIQDNIVLSFKFRLQSILHSNCDFYCLCTKYTHFEHVMQPVEAS